MRTRSIWERPASGCAPMPATSTKRSSGPASSLPMSMGCGVYLTCNILPTNEEADQLEEFLLRAADAGVDALIVADVGILMMARRLVPQIDIHISTQTGVVNWPGTGQISSISSVPSGLVLARELPLETMPGDSPAHPCGPGDRMLCAWRHVYVLLGTVPALRLRSPDGTPTGANVPSPAAGATISWRRSVRDSISPSY